MKSFLLTYYSEGAMRVSYEWFDTEQEAIDFIEENNDMEIYDFLEIYNAREIETK